MSNPDEIEAWRTALLYIVAFFSSVMCLVGVFFMVAILKTRKFTFNLYIIFAILPDALCNGILGFSLFTEAANSDGQMPSFLCSWMCFHLTFYYLSNLYINAAIAKEIYDLVLNSYHRRRSQPPSSRKVIVQVGVIYALVGLLSGWFVAPISSWTSIMSIENEPICVSKFKHPIGGMAVAMAFSMPPFLYVFWVAYKIKHEKLLPLKGRTRVLALYFMRIVVIFVAFYIPILLLATYGFIVAPGPDDAVSIHYFVTLQLLKCLFPIQNIVTFKFLLQKEDISNAVHNYISNITTCIRHPTRIRCSNEHHDDDDEKGSKKDNENDDGDGDCMEDNPTISSEWMLDDVYEDTTIDTIITTTITTTAMSTSIRRRSSTNIDNSNNNNNLRSQETA